MKYAQRLFDNINKIKGKLVAENIDLQDYDNAIKCLEQTVSPTFCIQIYETYIYDN